MNAYRHARNKLIALNVKAKKIFRRKNFSPKGNLKESWKTTRPQENGKNFLRSTALKVPGRILQTKEAIGNRLSSFYAP